MKTKTKTSNASKASKNSKSKANSNKKSKRVSSKRVSKPTSKREPKWIAWLIKHSACDSGVKWARKQRSLSAAWKNCRSADYMNWLLTESNVTGNIHYLDGSYARCFCEFRTPAQVRAEFPKPPILR